MEVTLLRTEGGASDNVGDDDEDAAADASADDEDGE
jgi:hypothetical protein